MYELEAPNASITDLTGLEGRNQPDTTGTWEQLHIRPLTSEGINQPGEDRAEHATNLTLLGIFRIKQLRTVYPYRTSHRWQD